MQEWFMPFTTKRQAISLAAEDRQRLESLRRSRSAEKREVVHAGILLDLAGGMSDGATARSNNVNRHTCLLYTSGASGVCLQNCVVDEARNRAVKIHEFGWKSLP